MTHLVKEQEKVMIIKRMSGASLVSHPHYKVNLSGDYSRINQYTSPDSLACLVRGCRSMGVMNDAVG